MKKHFILFLMLAVGMAAAMGQTTNTTQTVEKQQVEEEQVYIVVEDEPEFPGGMDELYQFIAQNLKYPNEALEKKVNGRVLAQFVVEKDGSISNIKIKHDIGWGCGFEVERVIKMMPKWKPGHVKGKPVRVQYSLPVNFSLK